MDREFRELKKAIAALPRRGPRGRRTYPREVRVAILDQVARERKSGLSLEAAVRRIGVPLTTVSSWLATRSATTTEVGGMRPVRIAPAAPAPSPVESSSGGVVLVTPGGYRVEGLSPEGVARLLQELT